MFTVTATSGELICGKSRKPIQVRLDRVCPKDSVCGAMAVMNRHFEVIELGTNYTIGETVEEMKELFEEGYRTIGIMCYGARNVTFVVGEGWQTSMAIWKQIASEI